MVSDLRTQNTQPLGLEIEPVKGKVLKYLQEGAKKCPTYLSRGELRS